MEGPFNFRLHTDSRVFFDHNALSWRVRGMTRDKRYTICTARPFGKDLYTIIDWVDGVRGPTNLIFGFWHGVTDDASVLEALDDLENGSAEVSRKNSIPLNIHKAPGHYYLTPKDSAVLEIGRV